MLLKTSSRMSTTRLLTRSEVLSRTSQSRFSTRKNWVHTTDAYPNNLWTDYEYARKACDRTGARINFVIRSLKGVSPSVVFSPLCGVLAASHLFLERTGRGLAVPGVGSLAHPSGNDSQGAAESWAVDWLPPQRQHLCLTSGWGARSPVPTRHLQGNFVSNVFSCLPAAA